MNKWSCFLPYPFQFVIHKYLAIHCWITLAVEKYCEIIKTVFNTNQVFCPEIADTACWSVPVLPNALPCLTNDTEPESWALHWTWCFRGWESLRCTRACHWTNWLHSAVSCRIYFNAVLSPGIPASLFPMRFSHWNACMSTCVLHALPISASFICDHRNNIWQRSCEAPHYAIFPVLLFIFCTKSHGGDVTCTLTVFL